MAGRCALRTSDRRGLCTGRAGDLPDWLSEAGLSPLASFARGLRAVIKAVIAVLRETWSKGKTEGQINRLKTLRRQMYGRASIDLLRAHLVATPRQTAQSLGQSPVLPP